VRTMIGVACGSILAAWVMLVSAAAFAGDWPQWRGPNRDGIVLDSPPLVEEFPKDGLKKLWESEPIPGGESQGGWAQPVVAAGRVFVNQPKHFRIPIDTRLLSKQALGSLGSVAGVPDDLVKAMEAARTSEDRAKLKGNELNKWLDEWIKTNMKPEQRKFQGAVRNRVALGTQALPLETLSKLEAVADKPFASQAEFDAWIKQQGIDDATAKTIMKRVPTTKPGGTDVLFCLEEATGKTLWKKEFPGSGEGRPNSTTLCVQGGKCWLPTSTGVVFCLDTKDGNVLWESKPFSGVLASSPLLAGGKVIFGTYNGIHALDAKTGELAWSGSALSHEGSPVAWISGGKSRIILATRTERIYCLDMETGKVLWPVPVTTGYTGCTPAVSGDVMVFCGGAPKWALSAYRISPEKPEESWSVPFTERYSCPVIYKGFVYAIGGAAQAKDKKGKALCVELATGKVVWDEMIGAGVELSSPIIADGKVIAQAGPWLYLIKADPAKYTLIGKANLGLVPWMSPAFADGKLFVRTGKNVVCYDLRKP